MATNTVVTLDSFKRGDTPTFYWAFTNPYTGFVWSDVTVDAAITSQDAPSDNTGAAATRLGQAVTTDTTGAHYAFTLTETESKALSPNTTYHVELQLRKGGTSVATPVTAKVKVLQDYVI